MKNLKYTRAEKFKIAKEHLIDGVSFNDLSKKYNYSTSIIKYQVQLYLKHGDIVFSESLIKTYTREEKLKVIEQIYSGKSIYSIAIEMGLSDPSIIKDWLIKYRQHGEAAIKDTFSRQAYKHHDDKILEREYKKLLEDLERTKAENEYLKKSFPQILKRSKQSSKK